MCYRKIVLSLSSVFWILSVIRDWNNYMKGTQWGCFVKKPTYWVQNNCSVFLLANNSYLTLFYASSIILNIMLQYVLYLWSVTVCLFYVNPIVSATSLDLILLSAFWMNLWCTLSKVPIWVKGIDVHHLQFWNGCGYRYREKWMKVENELCATWKS